MLHLFIFNVNVIDYLCGFLFVCFCTYYVSVSYFYFSSPFHRRGLTNELGAEAMMMDALEKVEKELKKPLMRNDKKGMALLTTEFDKINQK